jgi:hypothetical protein
MRCRECLTLKLNVSACDLTISFTTSPSAYNLLVRELATILVVPW